MTQLLLAGNAVFRVYSQNLVNAMKMEVVQVLDVAALVSPCFTAIEQGSWDYSSVDCNLVCFSDAALLRHSCPKVFQMCCWL